MAKPHAIILQKKNMKGEIADQVALMSRSLRSQSKLSLSEISDITIKQDTTLYPKNKSSIRQMNSITNFSNADYNTEMEFGFFLDGDKTQKIFSSSDKRELSIKELLSESNARGFGSGIKNINVELQGTNPANKDFSVVTINMGFSSFDELFTSNVIDLLDNQKDAYLGIGHNFGGRHRSFQNSSKLFMRLKYVIHNLSYNPDGSIAMEVKYASYLDFYNDSSDNFLFRPESDKLPELQKQLIKLEGSKDKKEKETEIKKLKKKISESYTGKYEELVYGIESKTLSYVPKIVPSGRPRQNSEDGKEEDNVKLYKFINATSSEEEIDDIEYVHLGDIVRKINDFYKKFLTKSTDKNYEGKVYLGKIFLNQAQMTPERSEYSEDPWMEFLEGNETTGYSLKIQGPKTIYLENMPVSKSFLRMFLSELDYSDVSASDGISAKRYIEKVVYELIYKIVSLYNDNLSNLRKLYSLEESPIYSNLRIEPFFVSKKPEKENNLAARRRKYLWRDKTKKTPAIQNFYVYQPDESVSPIELKFGPNNTLVKSINFSPVDTKLFDVAIVNAYKGQSLSNYGITDVIRTIYKLDLKMVGASFMTPGTIIKLSKNSFPTLPAQDARRHAAEFREMLTQEYLVTKVTHTLNSKNNYETQITAHPYKMIR